MLAASGVQTPVHNLTVSEMIKETNRPVDEQMVLRFIVTFYIIYIYMCGLGK